MQVIQVLQEARDPSLLEAWSPLLQTVVGGALAILGAIVGTWFAASLARCHARKSIRAALRGEIGALVEIADKRAYVRGIQEAIDRADREEHEVKAPAFSVRSSYFRVYEANVSNLGLLDADLAGKVSRFYTQATAFLESVKDWEGKTVGDSQGEIPSASLNVDRKLLEETLELGKALSRDL